MEDREFIYKLRNKNLDLERSIDNYLQKLLEKEQQIRLLHKEIEVWRNVCKELRGYYGR